MARLNTRPSIAGGTSGYDSPDHSDDASDQENREPAVRRHDKSATTNMDTHSDLLTPSSEDDLRAVHGQKRKRPAPGPTQRHDIDDESTNEDEAKLNRYFDPNQDPEERRQLKRKARALERDFHDNRDSLLRDNGRSLTKTVQRADDLYRNVKQTDDATLDSRLLVGLSDLAYKRTAQLVLGDANMGIDVNFFLSQCITFMRNGGPLVRADEVPTRVQRRPRGDQDSDEDEDNDSENGDAVLDWEVLGRRACFPNNTRPPVPSFLLGPLSMEKRQRAQTQRRARQTQEISSREARPEALTRAELSQSDQSGLTAICSRIQKHLGAHCEQAEQAAIRAGITEKSHPRAQAFFRKYRISETGGPSLFEYIINPHSFGQTVENLFYISFLIKEGNVAVVADEDGLPTILASSPRSVEEQREQKVTKHQAVLALDYTTWKQLTSAFDIIEPMIPHRNDEQPRQVGRSGWYA